MRAALQLAKVAERKGEVPIGAIIVREADGLVLGSGYNLTETLNSSMEHAEMRAIRAASSNLNSWRLNTTGPVVLYSTVEPCMMCLGASSLSRVSRIVFGARNSKFGGMPHTSPLLSEGVYKMDITGGILEDECKITMQRFFRNKRKGSSQESGLVQNIS